MSILDFLNELENKSEEEILLDLNQQYLSGLSPALRDITYRGAILRWFNIEVLKGIAGVGILSGKENIPTIEWPDTAELFGQLQQFPFTETFPHRGYCFHDLTRKLILEHLWKHEFEFYHEVSTKAVEYFQNLWEAQTKQVEYNSDESHLDWEILVETAYHTVIANEKKEVDIISDILHLLISEGKFGIHHAVLQAITEHASAGRMAADKLCYIGYWQLEEAYQTNDVVRLEDLSKELLGQPDTTTPLKVKAEATYMLADGLRLATRYEEATLYFEKNKKQQEAIENSNGVINAIIGLGDVEFERENYETAKVHFHEALTAHVQQLRIPASENSEYDDDTPLQIFNPEAWHRREYFEEQSPDQDVIPFEERDDTPSDEDVINQESFILYGVDIDFDKLGITKGAVQKDGTDLSSEWPVNFDHVLADIWLKLGSLFQATDKYDLASACGQLAAEMFWDLDDLSSSLSATQLLESLGSNLGDREFIKSMKDFRSELYHQASSHGDQRTLLYSLINQANSDMDEFRYSASREKFNQAFSIAESLKLENDKATCIEGLARVDWNEGNFDKAEEQFRIAIEIYKKVQNSQGYAWTLLSLSSLDLLIYRFPQAEESCNLALETFGNMGGFSGRFQSLLILSNIALSQGKYEKALECLKDALVLSKKEKRSSSEAEVLSEMGKIYLSIEDTGKAEINFSKALAISQNINKHQLTVSILLGKSQIFTDMAEYGKAVQVLDRVIELDPSRAEAFSAKGWALENIGSEKAMEAKEAYERAIELTPGDLYTQKGLANALWLAGDSEAAIAQYQWVAEQAEKDALPANLSVLAWSYYELQEYEKAEKIYSKLSGNDSKIFSDHFDFGLVLMCRGKFSESINVYESGINLLNQKHPVQCRRGFIYVAIDDIKEAIAINPGLANLKECIEIQDKLEEAWESTLANIPLDTK